MMDAVATDVAVLTLAAGLDTASTHYALSRCPSCYERSPWMREPAVGVAIRAASVAGTAVVCAKLRKSGHSRAAKVLRWTVLAVGLGVAAHNLRASR